MTCGGIATCDETGVVFSLLPAASAALTGSEGAENLAYLAQYVAMMGFIEDKVVDCFHRGGGVPYSEFPRFHEVMAQDSAQTVVGALFDHILPLVPGLALGRRLRRHPRRPPSADPSAVGVTVGHGRAAGIARNR